MPYFQNLFLIVVDKQHIHFFYLNQNCYIWSCLYKKIGSHGLLHFRDGLVLKALSDGAFS